MNKNEFFRVCAKESGVKMSEVEKVLEGARRALIGVLNVGQDVRIGGLGRFFVKVRPPRTMTNNLSGKEVLVGQKFCVVFRGSKKLSKEIG